MSRNQIHSKSKILLCVPNIFLLVTVGRICLKVFVIISSILVNSVLDIDIVGQKKLIF